MDTRAPLDPDSDLGRWLLGTDPALRWQVQRDLLDAPEEVWRATRARVTTEGYAARLLALQDEDGQWAGGAYFPTRNDPRAEVGDANEGQPWVATTWSLSALREWGVPAEALGDTAERLREHARWEYDDLPYWGGEVDVCINAWTLANGTWLGTDVSSLAAWFPEHQLADGGWNCEWVEGATASSFHSTLNALEGLLEREERGAPPQEREQLRPARHRGQEYLLERRLLRRRSTGELVGDWVTQLGYPPRWRYNVLRALDVFRRAAVLDGTAPDPRLQEAVDALRSLQGPDGRWVQQAHHEGQEWFPVDVPVGSPSPWLTHTGLRVLRWWDGRG